MLLELGEEFRDEATGIVRDVLASPYAHPNARENAAIVLSRCGPQLRAEALTALRAVATDSLADYYDRHFAARGLAVRADLAGV